MEGKVRSQAMDYFKGILVILMILAHCIQFFGTVNQGIQKLLSDYINLTTFSGFYFAYGFVCYLAYFQRDFKSRMPFMVKNALKTLGAYYLSSVCYLALAENKIFRWDYLYDIAALKEYKGYSEFLISFFGVMVLGIILFPLMKNMNLKIAAILTGVSIACCFLPYEKVKIPQLAFLTGAGDYVTFPVLQYMVYFIWGVCFGKTKTVFNKWVLAASLCVSLPAAAVYIKTGSFPQRFPPSASFVLGGAVFLYVYYLASNGLDRIKNKSRIVLRFKEYVSGVGRNTLFYLLLSNIFIFAFSQSAFTHRSEGFGIGFFVILLIVLSYLQHLVIPKKAA